MTRYRLYCYGTPYGEQQPSLAEAIATANAHIRECPEGAMEWATRIEWHEVGPTDERLRGWVSAARHQWLSHRIEELEQR